MPRTVKIRAEDLTVLLDLSGAGYELDYDGVRPGQRTWRRDPVSSPWADGAAPGVPASLEEEEFSLSLRVVGANSVDVEQRFQDLLAAVELREWFLEVVDGGLSIMYRASPADSAFGFLTSEMNAFFRSVLLTIPVQPGPSITGLEP